MSKSDEAPKMYWWCPCCRRVVDSYEVTFDEHHEDCGGELEARWTDQEYPDGPAKGVDGG